MLRRLVNVISPCILALVCCLVVVCVSFVQLLRGEAFAELALGIYLILSFPILLIDILTKKLTRYRIAWFWPVQILLLVALFLLTRAIVSSGFNVAN